MVKKKKDFFVRETISSFQAIQRYFELIESQVGIAKKEKWLELKKLPLPMDEDVYQNEFLPNIEIHKHEYETLLPRLIAYSSVTMLFSELDFRINEICGELKKTEKIPVRINDLKGDLVEQFSKYLGLANKPGLDKREKAKLDDFLVVHDCIVHNNGFLNNFLKASKLRSIAKSSKMHIVVNGKGEKARVMVSGGFLFSMIEFIIGMFQKLFENLNFGSV